MKQIILKQLEINKFKGVESLTIDFNSRITNIFGDNGTCKTTVFDAYSWLLFGKDSQGKESFSIKPLDSNNVATSRQENTVKGTFNIDGKEVELKRIFKEKWVKEKGSPIATFKGNETNFEINQVPKSLSEYTSFVSSIIDESKFKLISNVSFFPNMKWEDKRAMLIRMAGDVTDTEVAENDIKLLELLKEIEGKGVDGYKKELAAKKKPIKEELNVIPAKIEEAKRSILFSQKTEDELKKEAKEITFQIAEIDSLITDSSKRTEQQQKSRSEVVKQIYDLKAKVAEFEFEAKTKARKDVTDKQTKTTSAKVNLTAYKEESANVLIKIGRVEAVIATLTDKRAKELEKWHATNNTKFDEAGLLCSFCGSELKEDKVEELRARFNSNKAETLAVITKDGQTIAIELKERERELSDCKIKLQGIEQSIKGFENDLFCLEQSNVKELDYTEILKTNAEYNTVLSQISSLELSLNETTAVAINLIAERDRKQALSNDLANVNRQLLTIENTNKATARVEELEKQESILAQSLADLEGKEYICSLFVKKKIESLEKKINSMFSVVKFKMFNQLVNGGEEECCIILKDGVDYPSLNTASKINAGIDCINTISNLYNISAPVFIDGAESITNILPTNAQMVRLVVNGSDKSLRIN